MSRSNYKNLYEGYAPSPSPLPKSPFDLSSSWLKMQKPGAEPIKSVVTSAVPVKQPKSVTSVPAVPVKEQPKSVTSVPSAPSPLPKSPFDLSSLLKIQKPGAEPIKSVVTSAVPAVPVKEQPKSVTSVPAVPVKEQPKSVTSVPAVPVKEQPKSVVTSAVPAVPVKEQPKSVTSAVPPVPVKEFLKMIRWGSCTGGGMQVAYMPNNPPNFVSNFISENELESYIKVIVSPDKKELKLLKLCNFPPM